MTGCTARPDPGVSVADRQFLERFEACTLTEAEWTHLAHIRVAWICLALDSADAALERIRTGILRFNTDVLGRPEMYHETVTVAFTRLVADRRHAGEAWSGFASRIDDFLDRKSPVLLRYYSGNRLFSDEARARFIVPDLAELPAVCR